jgi:Zn-dependent M28 family amino/carboxypeptidase
VQGTLGEEGDYSPTIGISKAQGEEFVAAIAAGTPQVADLIIEQQTVTTYNVIAETRGGDHNNVIHLGGHSDSVAAGPGINDNGSGGIGILEVALALTKFKVKNAVRFSWWAAEEEGLLGALAYVKAQPQAELDKICIYLNFDMIASPNYVYAIYDGDGSTFNLTGPAGSAQAEHLFQDYFRDVEKVDSVPSNFDGRSDYGPFLDAGIACGGLFTGAEELKTAEEAVMFGGEAGVAYDINYHAAGDTVANCNATAFLVNTRAIAHSVAVLATSTAVLDEPLVRRGGYRDFSRTAGLPKKVAGGCGTKAL